MIFLLIYNRLKYLEANFYQMKLADRVVPCICEMCLHVEPYCLSSVKRAMFSNQRTFAAVQLAD